MLRLHLRFIRKTNRRSGCDSVGTSSIRQCNTLLDCESIRRCFKVAINIDHQLPAPSKKGKITSNLPLHQRAPGRTLPCSQRAQHPRSPHRRHQQGGCLPGKGQPLAPDGEGSEHSRHQLPLLSPQLQLWQRSCAPEACPWLWIGVCRLNGAKFNSGHCPGWNMVEEGEPLGIWPKSMTSCAAGLSSIGA
jgi:hypothetical protein